MIASSRVTAMLCAIAFPSTLTAQAIAPQAIDPAQQQATRIHQAPVCPPPLVAQQQPPAGNAEEDKGKKEEVPVAKEVGAAAAGTAGQIGGAAVAGPIGAAVGGVIASKVGEAVGSLVKKKKKNRDHAEAENDPQQQAEQAQALSGPGEMLCVAPVQAEQPQR